MSDVEEENGDDVEEVDHVYVEGWNADDDDSYNEYEDNLPVYSDCEMESEASYPEDEEHKKKKPKENDISKHALKLFNSLICQKVESKNLDLEIKVFANGTPNFIPVHKCVLFAYCPYIKSYLDNMPESKNQVIDLTHLNGDSVMEIINWVYSGNCNLTEENAQDILVSGDFLCNDEVVKLSVDFLCDNLSFKNCSEIYNLSHSYSVFDFQKRVYDYIITNFYPLFTQHYLDDLSVQDIISFTSDDKLMLILSKFFDLNRSDHEFKLIEVVKDYLERKNEQNLWPEFLTKSIRLGFLTESQLEQIIKDDKWLGTCNERKKCMELVNGVLSKQKLISKDFEFPIWNTPRKDMRVFLYYWTDRIAYNGYFHEQLPDRFNDLRTQLAKKEDKNALVVVRGVKIWLRMWDDIVVIGGIGLTYNDGTVVTHGLTEEQPEGVVEFKLKDGEYINQIDYRVGFLIDQITFHTNSGKKYGPYGGVGGDAGTFKPKRAEGFLAAMRGEKTLAYAVPIVRNVNFCWGYVNLKS